MKTAKGFSLVELMITTLIGLFLLAGITNIFIANKKSFNTATELAAVIDNGSFALETLTNAIKHTAYSPKHRMLLEAYFITDKVTAETCPKGGTSTKNIVNPSILRNTKDNAGGDSIGIIFHGDNNLFTDCTGEELPNVCRLDSSFKTNTGIGSSRIYNSFYLDKKNNTLNCAGSLNTKPIVLAEGVENIQFLYGIDTNGDVSNAERIVKSANITPSMWNNIINVQVALLVRSNKALKIKPESNKYTLLDEVITTPNDRFHRSVFSTTIRIRNEL